MRTWVLQVGTLTAVLVAASAAAQESDRASRQSLVDQAQAEKVETLHPYVPTTFERLTTRLQDILENQTITWHPYFESAALGGGLPIGAGYIAHVSPYNFID